MSHMIDFFVDGVRICHAAVWERSGQQDPTPSNWAGWGNSCGGGKGSFTAQGIGRNPIIQPDNPQGLSKPHRSKVWFDLGILGIPPTLLGLLGSTL